MACAVGMPPTKCSAPPGDRDPLARTASRGGESGVQAVAELVRWNLDPRASTTLSVDDHAGDAERRNEPGNPEKLGPTHRPYDTTNDA